MLKQILSDCNKNNTKKLANLKKVCGEFAKGHIKVSKGYVEKLKVSSVIYKKLSHGAVWLSDHGINWAIKNNLETFRGCRISKNGKKLYDDYVKRKLRAVLLGGVQGIAVPVFQIVTSMREKIHKRHGFLTGKFTGINITSKADYSYWKKFANKKKNFDVLPLVLTLNDEKTFKSHRDRRLYKLDGHQYLNPQAKMIGGGGECLTYAHTLSMHMTDVESAIEFIKKQVLIYPNRKVYLAVNEKNIEQAREIHKATGILMAKAPKLVSMRVEITHESYSQLKKRCELEFEELRAVFYSEKESVKKRNFAKRVFVDTATAFTRLARCLSGSALDVLRQKKITTYDLGNEIRIVKSLDGNLRFN